MTGHESSRQTLEHSDKAYLLAQKEHQMTRIEHAADVIAHEVKESDIAALAYQLWQGRSCPEGSPDDDWFRAGEELRSRHRAHHRAD